MKKTIFVVTFFFFLLLAGSCSLNSNNQESVDSRNSDSIINAKVKELIDATLSPYMRYQWESFKITNSCSNNDTVKNIKGTICSEQYFYKTFNVAGVYKIKQNKPICRSLIVSHTKAGNILEVKEMYDSVFTFYTDSASFLDNLIQYYEHPSSGDQMALDRYNLAARAYANETKVHFGMSEDEYITLGKDYQRNFYEGLIGKGAFELARPKFYKNKFIGFDIIGARDKSFSYNNVMSHARLVKKEQLGYDAHESFRYVYDCKLCKIEIYSGYDKFDRVYEHSLNVYWNE